MKALFCAMFVFATAISAQVAPPPAAPMPALLSNTGKVFLANAGDQDNADCMRAYNSFYQGLLALQRFKLVDKPSDADMIVELHYEIDLGGSLVSDHSRKSSRQFRAVLIDPKTHVTVWSLTEHANYAVFEKNRNKDLDESVAVLVHDFAMTVADQEAPASKPPGADGRLHTSR